MLSVIVLLFVTQATPGQAQWPTLAEELARHGVPITSAIDDGSKRITSYDILDSADWFGIGYYWLQEDGRLPQEVRIRTYDKAGKLWRSIVIPERLGSILHFRRHFGLFYVTGHYSPSASPTLVLNVELERVQFINGWPELLLPDGRVIFQDSVVHFAPAHPGTLSIYDPARDGVRLLYPETPYNGTGLELVNRRFGELTWDVKRHVVVVPVTESTVTIQPDNRGAEGPERRSTVACDLSPPRPRCTVRANEAR
jgi:hypothetical protein